MSEADAAPLTAEAHRLHTEWGHLTSDIALRCESKAGYLYADEPDPCRYYVGLATLDRERIGSPTDAAREQAHSYLDVIAAIRKGIDDVALRGLAGGGDADAWADGFRQGHSAAKDSVERAIHDKHWEVRAASGSPEPVLDPLRVAAQAYIDWRDKRLAQWQAVAKCGHPHDGSVPCPEWDEITGESFDVDRRLDDAIRAALATHASPAALVPEGDQG